VITAPRTRDLLRWTRLRQITELKWGESKTITTSLGQKIEVLAVPVKHWGARMQRDDYRGYNGYLIESHGRRILFTGDTAFTRDFADLRHYGRLADPRSAGQLLQSSANASPMRAARRNWATQPVETTGCPPGEKRIDLAIFSIGAYDPWIRNHSTPEQAIQMANDAGAKYIMPVHHQTFRLSFEPFREPIGRFEAALRSAPDRIALREIGETFVLPL
jgi:L-ascorbate metabolism protein UlaG (beta-lactamase superfamily)